MGSVNFHCDFVESVIHRIVLAIESKDPATKGSYAKQCVEGGHLLLFRHDEDYHHQCRKH